MSKAGNPKIRVIIKLTILILIFVFSFSSSAWNSDVILTELNINRYDEIIKHSEEPSGSHVMDAGAGLIEVKTSGFVRLYFDPSSYAVAIYQTNTEKYWYSLPVDDARNTDASILSLQVEYGGTIYELNSQDHSVGLSAASYELTENGINVNYIISHDDIPVSYNITVEYVLEDGSLDTAIRLENVKNEKGVTLRSLDFLEYFGATDDETVKDSYMMVPDGSGALIDLSKKVKEFEPVELQVYGQDLSAQIGSGEEDADAARFPAFGMKDGNSAFVAVIGPGDALSTIKADRSCGEGGYNKLYSEFCITPQASMDIGQEVIQYSAKEAYNDTIKNCYRFLSGSNANYTGMSIACREQLIRNGVLSSVSISETDYLPLNLNLIGSRTTRKSIAGNTFSSVEILTDFEQALDMAELMRSKGINNINLRYSGIFKGGDNQTNIGKLKLLSGMGGKNKYDELAEYLYTQKLSLYLDIDLLSSENDGSLNKNNQVTSITGTKTLYRGTSGLRRLMNLKQTDNTIATLLNKLKNYQPYGLSINDAGYILYSDFGKGGLNRQKAVSYIKKGINSLAVNSNLMIDTGNIYMLSQASVAVNMPLWAGRESGDGSYISIPFLQMLVHGYLDYSGNPVNLSEDYKYTMLRYIEYGACPYFEFTYKNSEDMSERHYAEWMADAAKYYEEANQTLADLRDTRISGHYEVKTGVYCTEYENGVIIYVNYNEESIDIDGIEVSAKDWQRVG